MKKDQSHHVLLGLGILWTALLITSSLFAAPGDAPAKPLILQEMTWTDVREYLKTNDMVIIPLGSTEQHGPHLPLGTDFYEAFEISKKISARTGVIIAPVVLSGYSIYHSGFPGGISLKPETLAQVLYETAENLEKYGFKKIMFFNFHGGNQLAEDMAIMRINHSTSASAIKIGIYSPIHSHFTDPAPFDYHAGIGETSYMLFLKPELVKMERCEKPTITFTEKMKLLQELIQTNPELAPVMSTLTGVPAETGKGGASHELSSNGVWTLGDPRTASPQFGKNAIEPMIDASVKFIEAWKKAGK